MRYNILIGGKAGQGINKISEIVSSILVENGYFTFNYRDYPSLIRGGHNFNVLSFSDKRVGSIESEVDGIVALDDKTIEIHKKQLKKNGFIIDCKGFEGRNVNVALAAALLKILGLDKKRLIEKIKKFGPDAVKAAEKGFDSEKEKFKLEKLKNKVEIMSGTQAIALGALNSGIDLYVAYPMTPATGVMHELAEKDKIFQAENEISVVNMALGASFVGSKVMIGTSGGGYDLMTEALSFQGQSEIPLTVYLASRPGPGTGVPTYTSQQDLNIALRGGHGEFPRVVIAPGDPIEAVEKTNEAMYLSEKFGCLSIVLSDKHLAESEFSSDRKPNKIIPISVKRNVPGKKVVKASGYEHDSAGNTTESPELTKKNADERLKKYEDIKKECKKFQMTKTYGKGKNLIIGWGSTKTVILDAMDWDKCKFLQVLYLKPLSEEIEKEMKKAKNVMIVEQNSTGQLGRLIREKTEIKIENRILKYDSRPFKSDELKKEIEEKLR